MNKNWLIRTKNNHILGPVSKEKVQELVNNGSIKGDDEICTGNGYWFFIKESDLVGRYLMGEEVQTFNPINEADDVLTEQVAGNTQENSTQVINLNELKLEGAAGNELETSSEAEKKK